MLLETAQVVAVEADSVWVESIRKSACGACTVKKACGHTLLNHVSSGQRNYLQVFSGSLPASHCSIEDHVLISIPEQVILRGSMVVYMLPLITMLIGAAVAVASTAGAPDLLAILGAVVGFGLGIGLVRWHAWQHRSDKSMQPSLVDFVYTPADCIAVS